MKHLRTKLLAAVAMLAIAAIMMTTASYAWFTISTNPEISDINAQVTSNGNLEIQLAQAGSAIENFAAPAPSAVGDAGKNQTWGNLVDLKEYFTTNTITLKPVEATYTAADKAYSFKYPEFGLDGRIKTPLKSLNKTAVSNGTHDNFKDYAGGIQTYNVGTSTDIWCFEIDFFLRTNVAGNITLGAAENRDTNTPTGSAEGGLGSTIKYADTTIAKNQVTIKLVEYTPVQDGVDEASAAVNHNVAIGTLTNGEGTLTLEGGAIELAANQYKLVKIYVYMDGANMTNADFINNANTAFTLNFQFDSDQTLRDMHATQTGYQAGTANGGTETARPAN